MFRLPVCPHCGTIYRYKDTKEAIRKKNNTCYHCKKQFIVKLLPYVAVEALILAALCIGVNVFLLMRMEKLNLVLLFAVTLVFLLLMYIFIPFFITFRKIGNKKEPITENKMNQKRDRRL